MAGTASSAQFHIAAVEGDRLAAGVDPGATTGCRDAMLANVGGKFVELGIRDL